MQNLPRGLLALFAIGLLGLLFLAPFVFTETISERSYAQFRAEVQQGEVAEVLISGPSLTAAYRDGTKWRIYPPQSDAALVDELISAGVKVSFQQRGSSAVGMILTALVPLILLGGIIWYIHGQAGDSGGAGQVFSVSQSRARLYAPGDRQVTMNDVAGLAEVKEELWEIVDFLRSPGRYLDLGARIPKGVLLSGPPGTGKTLLARAVAGEAGVPFFTMSGSEFVEIFAGVGASRVRDLFEKARSHAPCIIFVDEIDAVGRQRGVSFGGGNDEREQTLNQLLVEMDGFTASEGIIVMAATNRIDVLDQALLRPGRFDRQILVDPPDKQGRIDILRVHALGKRMAPDVNLERIAGTTVGFTGADLANLLNEAALLAARRRKEAITMAELRDAFERVLAGGPELRRAMAEQERVRVAYHEAGHAVVSRHLATSDPIEKVTITPRGRALGYVMHLPREERFLQARQEICDRIVMLLGGRAAEEVALATRSSGAADDLERATGLARRMVTELGMSQAIGPIHLPGAQAAAALNGPGVRLVSNRMASAADAEVSALLCRAYDQAVALVRQHRAALERVAAALLERETLDGQELDLLLDGGE